MLKIQRFLRNPLIIALIAVFLSTSAEVTIAYQAEPKTVTLIDNGTEKVYETLASTVESFFNINAIMFAAKDQANVNFLDPITDGMVINITRGYNISVRLDNATEVYRVAPGETIAMLVGRISIAKQINYIYKGTYGDFLYDGQTIQLQSRIEVTNTFEQPADFVTEYVESNEILLGSEAVQQEGQTGAKNVTYKIVFVGGKEESRQVIQEEIVVAPVNQIIAKGTKQKGFFDPGLIPGEDFQFTKQLVVEATAYSAGYESTRKNPGDPGYGITATGMKAVQGVIAVDPDVIPLGTRLYVEGYGYAIAGDIGGSIIGNRIDIFYESLSDCYRFGRRKVNVYILN